MGDVRGVLHGQEAGWLIDAWSHVPEKTRLGLIRQRPLLDLIDPEPRPTSPGDCDREAGLGLD